MTLQFIGRKPRAYGTALLLTVLFLAVAGCPLFWGAAGSRSEPEVTIGAAQDGVTEGEAVSFTVTAMPAPAADLVVSVTVTETGDTLGASVPQQVTIAAGKTTATLQVTTVDDTADESNSTVTATVTAGTGYTVGSPDSAEVTVADDDGASTPGPTLPPATPDLPHVTITAVASSVTEGQPATFTVRANPAPAMDLMVSVTVTETGTTLAASVPENVTVAAGQTTATLQVTTVDDTADESDSTVTATVTAGTGYTVGSPDSAEVTVADDDGASTPGPTLPPATPDLPHVTIMAVASSVTEGQPATFTVRANPAPAMDLMVSVTVTETGTTLAASVPENVTVAAGQTTATLQVTTVDDTADESDSTVTARVASGTGYTVGSRSSARVTVADNDEPAPQPEPQVTIAADGDVTEGEAVSFTVTATPAPAMDLMVSVTVTENGATLAASLPDNVTVAAGQTTATLRLTTVDDTTDESDSTVTARVASGTGYTVGSRSSARVTVADNDPPPDGRPTVSITNVSPNPVTEGDVVAVLLSANPAPTEEIRGNVFIQDSGVIERWEHSGSAAATRPVPLTIL